MEPSTLCSLTTSECHSFSMTNICVKVELVVNRIFLEDNEVGRACGTHGRGEKGVQGFGGKA
jgi:hypothetical protein